LSKHRLGFRVRKNPDYEALARYLKGIDLRHRVGFPGRREHGHPAILIALPDGGEVAFTIASTPMGGCNTKSRVAELKRFLAKHGINPA
jgi:hypothetical protein